MAEIFFYHLDQQPLERILPDLVRRGLERGIRMVIETASPDNLARLSEMLWKVEDVAFLAHGFGDDVAHRQPLWLCADQQNPNSAAYRFYVDGAMPENLDGLAARAHHVRSSFRRHACKVPAVNGKSAKLKVTPSAIGNRTTTANGKIWPRASSEQVESLVSVKMRQKKWLERAGERMRASAALPQRLRYRLLTGPDDNAFCERVSKALDEGYALYGSPSVTFNGTNVIAAQALVLKTTDLKRAGKAPSRPKR